MNGSVLSDTPNVRYLVALYFDRILHTYACQHCLTTGMHSSPVLVDEALLGISPACLGQLVTLLITFESRGIAGSNFAYLSIYTFSNHEYAK